MRIDEVEYAISRIVPEFEESYEDINLFYKKLFKIVENEEVDRCIQTFFRTCC